MRWSQDAESNTLKCWLLDSGAVDNTACDALEFSFEIDKFANEVVHRIPTSELKPSLNRSDFLFASVDGLC